MSEALVVRAGYGEKSETMDAVRERLKSAKMAIVTEYRGLTVAQMTKKGFITSSIRNRVEFD